ncbi:MAG TPA: hypothetical protein VFH38_12900 [Jatrophihabitans sp.]|nr:hypothetical protein [Jatrophihabitans sp.]
MPSIRVLSVDARSLAPSGPGRTMLVTGPAPDAMCVHGAPHLLRWRSRCAALAREAGLVVVGGGRTGGGNLLLSSLGVDVVATSDTRFRGSTLRSPAGAAVALLRRGDSALVLAAARLGADPDKQVDQVRELEGVLDNVAAHAEPAGIADPQQVPRVVSVAGSTVGEAAGRLLADARAVLRGRLYVDRGVGVEEPAGDTPADPAPADAPVAARLDLPPAASG